MADERYKKVYEAINARSDYYDLKTQDSEANGREDLANMYRNHGNAMYEALEIVRSFEHDLP